MEEINLSNLYDRHSPKGLANMWRQIGFKKEKITPLAQMELYNMNYNEFEARENE